MIAVPVNSAVIARVVTTMKDFPDVRSDRLLYSVLPISVASELRHSRPVPAKKYDCVTLLFSGIVGFGAYCAAHTDSSGAMKIVNMLNQLYIAYDVLTDPKKNPNVYKVTAIIEIICFMGITQKNIRSMTINICMILKIN